MPPSPRSALIPCDSSHLSKDVSIPLVNDWSSVADHQGDVKLFRRCDDSCRFLSLVVSLGNSS